MRVLRSLIFYLTSPFLTYRSYQSGHPPPKVPFGAIRRVEYNCPDSIGGLQMERNIYFVSFTRYTKRAGSRKRPVYAVTLPLNFSLVLTLSDISTRYNRNYSSCKFSKPQQVH